MWRQATEGEGRDAKLTSKTAAVIAYTSAPSIIAGRGCVQGGIVVTAGSVVVAHAWFAWVPIRSGTIVPWLVIVEGKASLALYFQGGKRGYSAVGKRSYREVMCGSMLWMGLTLFPAVLCMHSHTDVMSVPHLLAWPLQAHLKYR